MNGMLKGLMAAAALTVLAPAALMQAASAPQTVVVKLSEWSLGAKTITVKGTMARFEVENDGQYPHDFRIQAMIGDKMVELATPVLKKGEKAVLIASLPAGTYNAYCDLPTHADKGMKANLTFEAAK
ncbi:cupredoxin domain-containing protein [Deinococcus sonorensis]|uniref:Cupredoxin domain-containing protein n=2 Tax=Deinococcus sonorensis TaxID=309891 RepID=A0AAU7U8K1_9DEIO